MKFKSVVALRPYNYVGKKNPFRYCHVEFSQNVELQQFTTKSSRLIVRKKIC